MRSKRELFQLVDEAGNAVMAYKITDYADATSLDSQGRESAAVGVRYLLVDGSSHLRKEEDCFVVVATGQRLFV